MKPIILICGMPHSKTSMVSKFLIDNGGYNADADARLDMLGYDKHENGVIQDWVKYAQGFKFPDLTEYFRSLPDKTIIIKSPNMFMFLDKIVKYTDREIRVVLALRNVIDVYLSTKQKSNQSFSYVFGKYNAMFRFIEQNDLPLFVLLTERLYWKDEYVAKKVLNFCDLPVKNYYPAYDGIDFSGIEDISKRRKLEYSKYRFKNFFWKRLAWLFRI